VMSGIRLFFRFLNDGSVRARARARVAVRRRPALSEILLSRKYTLLSGMEAARC